MVVRLRRISTLLVLSHASYDGWVCKSVTPREAGRNGGVQRGRSHLCQESEGVAQT